MNRLMKWPREFQLLWFTTGATNLSDGLLKLSLPLVALAITDSPLAVAATIALNSLPWLAFSLVAGVMADRLDRRRLMSVLNLLRTVVLASLALSLAVDHLSLPGLYVAALAMGVCETFIDTTRISMVQTVAPRDRLEGAYARLSATETVTNEFIGPPLGGMLLGAALSLPLFVGSIGYAMGAVALMALPGLYAPERGAKMPRVGADIKEGLLYVWSESTLRTLLLVTGVITACWAGWLAVFPSFAVGDTIGLRPEVYGVLIGAVGLGGVVGALSAQKARMLLGRRQLLLAALGAVAVMMLGPVVSTSVTVLAITSAAGGFGSGAWSVAFSTMRALIVPDHQMGRYSGVSRLITYGSMPIGAMVAGATVQLGGFRLAFAGAGAIVGVAIVCVLVAVRNTEVQALDDMVR